jgi:hypothetical protein
MNYAPRKLSAFELALYHDLQNYYRALDWKF